MTGNISTRSNEQRAIFIASSLLRKHLWSERGLSTVLTKQFLQVASWWWGRHSKAHRTPFFFDHWSRCVQQNVSSQKTHPEGYGDSTIGSWLCLDWFSNTRLTIRWMCLLAWFYGLRRRSSWILHCQFELRDCWYSSIFTLMVNLI